MRTILFFFVTVGLFGCSTPQYTPSEKSFGHVAIMQGATSAEQAQFVAAIERGDSVQVELLAWPTKKILLRSVARAIEQEHSNWKLLQFRLSALQPDTTYGLRLKGDLGNWVDVRSFKTLPLNPQKFRVAVVSCMRDDLKGTERIWSQLQRDQPDLLFMIGDNAYTDVGLSGVLAKMSPQRIWDRHMMTRNALSVFRWQHLVPVFATWDDHDYGVNNGGSDFSLKQDSAKIFNTFFPMDLKDERFTKGPGVARRMRLGAHNFLFLDNRSFRDSRKKNPTGPHFGVEQRKWLTQQIKSTRLNWLISGDQFFGAYHPFDSFEGQHPKTFKDFLQDLKKQKAPFFFVSGDRHMSEIMQLNKTEVGRTTYEITSSPIHSSVYPEASRRHPNPRRRHSLSGQWNYALLDWQDHTSRYEINVNVKGSAGQVFFQDLLKISKK